jgi:D-sedoheptulose 7-phosphate isomerase
VERFVEQYRSDVLRAIDSIPLDKVEQAIDWFRTARDERRRIFVCGNGGSAAMASHFACELLKGASYGRESKFRILALTDPMPTITAYANDVSYESIFVEQLKNFAEPGDLFMGLSSSGNSMNVIRAIEYANSAGCRTIALTGFDGGKLASLGQLNIHIPTPHTGKVEDALHIVCHMICYHFMEGR